MKLKQIKEIKLQKILIPALLLIIALVMTSCASSTGNIINQNSGETKMNEHVILETSLGKIELELFQEEAPISTKNFLLYVREGYYNGTVFHRVIPNFMVQGGGFTKAGEEKDTKDPIVNEANNGLKNKRGTLAMARTHVVNSATSQFFINTIDNEFLNYKQGGDFGYAVFAEVVNGMDIVDQISATRTQIKHGMKDWPSEEITIIEAYVKKDE